MSTDENNRTRREFLRGLVESGVAVRLAPLLVAAAELATPAQVEAGVFDSPHARRSLAAFADAVIPPDDQSPGGAACDFVGVALDPAFYSVFLGFEVPIAPALRVLVTDLDRRCLWHHRCRFADASPEAREDVLDRGLAGAMRLVYEGMIALVKAVVFGGQASTQGWTILGYPGPADAYPDASPSAPPPTHSITSDGNPP